MRKPEKFIVLDTETANTRKVGNNLEIHSALTYDVGWRVMDRAGHIYDEKSYAIRDVYINEREIMQSAFYKDKLPSYAEEIRNGERVLADFMDVFCDFRKTCKEFDVKAVCAHNARFDVTALNATLRYLTKSKFRYFFPANVEIWDSMKMAKDVICKMPTYRKFSEEFDTLTASGRVSAGAENLYKYISNNPYYEEVHKGIDDVIIESAIVLYCFRQHKKMNKVLYPAKV